MGFSPHIAPLNVKFGMNQRTYGPLPVPNFTFLVAEMWEYSPKIVKI